VVEAPGGSWTHPNPAAGHLLAQWVRGAWRREHSFWLDLCCGVGTVTLALAPGAERILAVDEDRHGLEALRRAAAEASLPQVETRAGRVGAVLRKLRRELVGQARPTAAVINPMRRPLGASQLRDLPHLGLQELVYLGPAPVSAARDVAWLSQHGFSLRSGAVVNLHPSTARFMLALVLEADGDGV
jgi:23S rRNA (uracil1939-C5)-methyltransferase